MAVRRFSLAQVAKKLGVTKGTVSKWKRLGLPLDADGRITLADAQAWRASRPRRVGMHDGEALIPEEKAALADDDEGRKALTQYRRAKAMREMMRVRELRGELVPLTEIDGLLVRRALEFRRGLEALENKLPSRFPEVAAKLKQVLHAEFRSLLERYSRSDPLLEGARRRKKK